MKPELFEQRELMQVKLVLSIEIKNVGKDVGKELPDLVKGIPDVLKDVLKNVLKDSR